MSQIEEGRRLDAARVALIHAVAARIREVDGRNKLTANELGWELTRLLSVHPYRVPSLYLVRYVKRVNNDKSMDAGELAEAIVTAFNRELGV